MFYELNKRNSRTHNAGKPSLTDQSQAKDTDINVIVGRYIKTGLAPGAPIAPINGDFTHLPQDLRGFLDTSRTLHANRNKLPKELRNMPVEELLALTPDKLKSILTPAPAPAPAPAPGTTP